MVSNSKLPITLENIKPNYDKPESKNNLVCQKRYDKVDDTVLVATKIGSNGVTYIEEDKLANIFQENKADTQYLVDNKITQKHKRNVNGLDLIHSSAIVGLLDERAQETRSASKQALQQYSRDSLINISDSDQAQRIRRNLDDFNRKEQRKLRTNRTSEVDEITGDALEKGYAFHHKNQQSLHTDPENSLNPDKGILVNNDTHTKIHRKKIRDEKALESYKKEINSK